MKAIKKVVECKLQYFQGLNETALSVRSVVYISFDD